MAKMKLNPLLGMLQGTIGSLVVVHEKDQIYVRSRGERAKALSPAQRAQVARFREAAAWARLRLLNPSNKAAYQRACQGHLSPYNLAIQDFLHGPVIDSIDLDAYTGQPGSPVRIRAVDDFSVIQVTVRIRSVTGDLIEDGAAERHPLEEGTWIYLSKSQIAAGTTVAIEAEARDGPGNGDSKLVYSFIR